MICFAKEFVRQLRRKPIRLRQPGETLIITGCRKEQIDAELSPDGRIRRLVIFTRYRPPPARRGLGHLLRP